MPSVITLSRRFHLTSESCSAYPFLVRRTFST
jgi:hypothetical protein